MARLRAPEIQILWKLHRRSEAMQRELRHMQDRLDLCELLERACRQQASVSWLLRAALQRAEAGAIELAPVQPGVQPAPRPGVQPTPSSG